ncbi:DUF5050 domain-containing protein [Paenibacillus sp. FSL L8-0436]|uniref:stalk domain-containing protein n=1 Tax=Paenibacillus sp. FSL L8-0436 TaxID=2954686 RepID=UPI003158FA0D
MLDNRLVLKITSLLVGLWLIWGGTHTATVAAQQQKITVIVDGMVVNLPRNPVTINNINYVPLRGLFERLGVSIQWDQNTSTITASKGAQTMEYTLGNYYARINGVECSLSSPGQVIDGDVMIPLRFVGETFGAELTWRPDIKSIQITSDEKLLSSVSAEPTGNSAANLTNSGFLVKQGEWIYGLETNERLEGNGHTYVSEGSSGYLYKINQSSGDKTRLISNQAQMLNIQGDWLYFLGADEVSRVRTDGSGLTQLANAPGTTQLFVLNDWLLYNTENGIYRLQLDREGALPVRVLDNSNIDQITVSQGWIYYKENRNGELPGIIGKVRINGTGNVSFGRLDYEDLTVQGDYLYFTYIDESTPKIGRMPVGGGSLQSLSAASGYNISGNKLYFGSGPILYQSEMDGSGRQEVATLEGADMRLRINLLDGAVYYEKGVFASENNYVSAMYAVNLSSKLAYSLYGKVLPKEFVHSSNVFSGAYVSNLPEKDPKIEYEAQQTAKAVIEQTLLPGMTTRDKVKALHDYVVLNTAYDYDNYLNGTIPEESYSEYGVLVLHTGVCQGYALTMKMLLDLADVENYYIAGTNNEGDGHAWNIVVVDGVYYHLDATWDDPVPNIPGYTRYTYFLIPDEQMALSHKWDRDTVKGFFSSL